MADVTLNCGFGCSSVDGCQGYCEPPHRVQLSRRKGWRMPRNTVKVDRTTRYGNDFIMAHEGTRQLALASFRERAEAQWEANAAFYAPLRGKNLACWCPPEKPCHADILLEIVNRPTPPEPLS